MSSLLLPWTNCWKRSGVVAYSRRHGTHVTWLWCNSVSSQRCYMWDNSLRWRHIGRDRVSNHKPYDCLLNRLFRRRSKKASKLRVTGLCVGNSPGTGEFPAQMASYAENVSIWWRHHVTQFHWIIYGFINWLLIWTLQWTRDLAYGWGTFTNNDWLKNHWY